MTRFLRFCAVALLFALVAPPAFAGYDHGVLNPESSTALVLRTDTDAITCRVLIDDITHLRPAYVNCTDFLSANAAQTLSANLTLNDGSGASPSLTFTDGTPETSVFSKVNAGYLTLTTDATDGLNILTGNLKVGNGTPDVTLNGEDAYVEGTFEVDGARTLDGAGTYAGANTYSSGSSLILASGNTLSVDGVTVNRKMLSLPGRATITICGDGTTINNNTVYYGPSMVPIAGGRTCDITAAGNTTEATADEKAFDATAFQVLSMDCLTTDPGASGVSFTLRTAAGATTPSVTCSVANTKLGCTANVQTTTAIASGAVIDIAAASAGNQGTTPFACSIAVAY